MRPIAVRRLLCTRLRVGICPGTVRTCTARYMTTVHPSQTGECQVGGLAERHASVLLAKSTEELAAAYDKWAEQYDEDLAELCDAGGENLAGVAAARVLPRHTSPQTHPRLLDAGCGTGNPTPTH